MINFLAVYWQAAGGQFGGSLVFMVAIFAIFYFLMIRPRQRRKSERERMLIQRARDNLVAVAFCNLVGGQDELVFDGHSVVIDHEGAAGAGLAGLGEREVPQVPAALAGALALDENDASVTLDGLGASIPQLAGLATNVGALSVVDGASFATSASDATCASASRS